MPHFRLSRAKVSHPGFSCQKQRAEMVHFANDAELRTASRAKSEADGACGEQPGQLRLSLARG